MNIFSNLLVMLAMPDLANHFPSSRGFEPHPKLEILLAPVGNFALNIAPGWILRSTPSFLQMLVPY